MAVLYVRFSMYRPAILVIAQTLVDLPLFFIQITIFSTSP